MTNQLVPLTDLPDEKLGQLIAQSGYFQDAKQAGQAVVKVIAGREIGLGPIASMTGIYIVQGRVAFGANVMAAALKRTGRYTYRVTELTDNRCTIDFFEIVGGKREPIGASTFTKEDAAKAGTKNMDKFPKNMLFARAMSNGVKWYAPDVFAGAPIYTPEELGAEVNEDGDVIDARPILQTETKTEQQAVSGKEEQKTEVLTRPYAPAELRLGLLNKVKAHKADNASANQRKLAVITLANCFAGEHADKNRHTFQKWIFGVESSKDFADAHVLALLDWLKPAQDSGGAWGPDKMAEREALAVIGQAMIDAGQLKLEAA
jgi:hypothetical protein